MTAAREPERLATWLVRSLRRTTLLVVAVLLALWLAPGTSSAATTIGIPTAALLGGNANLAACPSCSYAQFSGPLANLSLYPGFAAPFSGVIVRWRLGSGSAGNPIVLRVLRSFGPPTGLVGAGTGTTRTTALGVTTYENEHLRISGGDTIGLNDANTQLLFRATASLSDVAGEYMPAIPDNSASSASFFVNRLLQLNADIEPDADNDGFGDETQDACPNGAAIQGPCADLQVIKQSAATTFTPGQNLAYTLTARNNGSQAAGSASVVDTLPAGASLVSATSAAGPCSGTTTVTCPLGNLAVGASLTIGVVIRPPARASITNTAAVIGSLPDPNPSNNVSSLLLRDLTQPTVSTKAGTNGLRFQGRLSSRRRLAAGSYTVLVVASDAAGNVSSTRSTRITLVR